MAKIDVKQLISTSGVLEVLRDHHPLMEKDRIDLCQRGIELANSTRELKLMAEHALTNWHLICALITRAECIGHDDGVNDH